MSAHQADGVEGDNPGRLGLKMFMQLDVVHAINYAQTS